MLAGAACEYCSNYSPSAALTSASPAPPTGQKKGGGEGLGRGGLGTGWEGREWTCLFWK